MYQVIFSSVPFPTLRVPYYIFLNFLLTKEYTIETIDNSYKFCESMNSKYKCLPICLKPFFNSILVNQNSRYAYWLPWPYPFGWLSCYIKYLLNVNRNITNGSFFDE